MTDEIPTIHALVVDDEDTVQSILAAFLNRYAQQNSREIQIRTLSDPVQGLFELTTNGERYNLILLDVRLPMKSRHFTTDWAKQNSTRMSLPRQRNICWKC